MKKLIALLVLLIPSQACSVDIDAKDRVKNQKPGFCAWASLETLGNHHKIKKMNGLLESRKGLPSKWIIEHGWLVWVDASDGFVTTIKEKLDELKVKYYIREYGERDLLPCVNDYGAAVGMSKETVGADGIKFGEAHMIILTRYNKKMVRFIDPNDRQEYEASREWFDKYWEGVIVIVEK